MRLGLCGPTEVVWVSESDEPEACSSWRICVSEKCGKKMKMVEWVLRIEDLRQKCETVKVRLLFLLFLFVCFFFFFWVVVGNWGWCKFSNLDKGEGLKD